MGSDPAHHTENHPGQPRQLKQQLQHEGLGEPAEQQALDGPQQQSLEFLLNIINQVAKDDPTGVFEYPVVRMQDSRNDG